MESARELSTIDRIRILIGIKYPRPLFVIPQQQEEQKVQDIKEPSQSDFITDLDMIQTWAPINRRVHGIVYIERYTSSKRLDRLSKETQDILGINGKKKDLLVRFAFDGGRAMMVSLQITEKGSTKKVSYIIQDPSSPISRLEEMHRQDFHLTSADAILVAKFGREKLTRV